MAKQIFSRFLPSSARVNSEKRFVGLTSNRVREKGGKGKITVSAHWNKHFLMDALSSVSEQSVKSWPFLLLQLCRTVVLSGEASEI